MWKKVDEFIEEQKMFTAEDVVIAGVSGGADSMCLLCVLDEWRQRLGFQLVVVHVNHGLRGETADAEEAYVRTVCKERGIPFEGVRVCVREVAEAEKRSEEEAGRECRRRAFMQAVSKYHGTKIALAHHKNDNAETFLFHLVRGSRLKGLGGMAPIHGMYVRPLLCVDRTEIEAYLKERQVAFCTDESNATDRYTRNRIRNHILPELEEQVNVQAVEQIHRTMGYFRRVHAYLEKEVDILWEKVVVKLSDGAWLVSSYVLDADPLLAEALLKRVLSCAAGTEKDLGDVHVQAVMALFEKQCGKGIDLPYGLCAVRTYEGVRIRPRDLFREAQRDRLTLTQLSADEQTWIFQGYEITARVFPRTDATGTLPKKAFTKWFDYDIIESDICLRTRMAGDWIVIDGSGSRQKVKKFFINAKIPAQKRGEIPLLAVEDQILWIAGYRQSQAYRVSEQTRNILEITISGGNEDGREDQGDDIGGRD